MSTYLRIHGPSVSILVLQLFTFLWSMLGLVMGFPLSEAVVTVFGFTTILSAVLLAAEER